jgi:hypothetical protein
LTTWWAPALVASSAFSALLTVLITVTPAARASSIAK